MHLGDDRPGEGRDREFAGTDADDLDRDLAACLKSSASSGDLRRRQRWDRGEIRLLTEMNGREKIDLVASTDEPIRMFGGRLEPGPDELPGGQSRRAYEDTSIDDHVDITGRAPRRSAVLELEEHDHLSPDKDPGSLAKESRHLQGRGPDCFLRVASRGDPNSQDLDRTPRAICRLRGSRSSARSSAIAVRGAIGSWSHLRTSSVTTRRITFGLGFLLSRKRLMS